jgi:hypothetical protein
MRPLLFAAILSATCVAGLAGDSLGNPAPQMLEISQKSAKPGEIITVSGLGLNTKNVDEIYLTDHKFDMRVKVIEQKDTEVKIRVPPFAKPGRMQLLFLTRGDKPLLLEQPVYLLIEDPETDITTATAKASPIGTDSSKTDDAVAQPAKTEPTKDSSKADQAKPDSAKEQVKPEAKPEAKTDSVKLDGRQPK